MAHNRFSRLAGSTYRCECCGRNTRNTGQSFSSKTCAQCYELAGIENEINDGHCVLGERMERIDTLVAEIRAKGGEPSWFADQFEGHV